MRRVASVTSMTKPQFIGARPQPGFPFFPILRAKLGFLALELRHFLFNGTYEGVMLRLGNLIAFHRRPQLCRTLILSNRSEPEKVHDSKITVMQTVAGTVGNLVDLRQLEHSGDKNGDPEDHETNRTDCETRPNGGAVFRNPCVRFPDLFHTTPSEWAIRTRKPHVD
jgi:hypothetical protein